MLFDKREFLIYIHVRIYIIFINHTHNTNSYLVRNNYEREKETDFKNSPESSEPTYYII